MPPSNHVPQKQETPIHEYQLFVAGDTMVSQRAIKNCRTLLEKYLNNNFSLDLTDIYKQPEKAVDANIITTPALIRKKPLPELTIIGDLSDLEKVARELLLY
jgi:circadian clock protein KaiB